MKYLKALPRKEIGGCYKSLTGGGNRRGSDTGRLEMGNVIIDGFDMLSKIDGYTIFSLFVYLFLFLLAVLWFFLPFAIFGIKERLVTLIAESQRTNVELSKIVDELSAARAELSQKRQQVDRDVNA